MARLASLPLFDELIDSRNVLICGAGGGFDIYCGLPLYFALRQAGKRVLLGNLSFTNLRASDAEQSPNGTFRVHALTQSDAKYFPELALAQWLAQQEDGANAPIYCFEKQGVATLKHAYQTIVDENEIDAILLVDGGTDSLMRGDEAELGTPHEDMLSIAAVAGIDTIPRYLACLGFGVDAYHGICHAHFLEAVAALSKQGRFLGTFSLLPQMPEVRRYQQAVEHAHRQLGQLPSIVNGSICSAIEGDYGDIHSTSRTRGSELWINPLMSMYWCFDLMAVADRVLYLQQLQDTQRYDEVVRLIEGFHRSVQNPRPFRPIPV